jgi:hypothetical protein
MGAEGCSQTDCNQLKACQRTVINLQTSSERMFLKISAAARLMGRHWTFRIVSTRTSTSEEEAYQTVGAL